MVVTDNVVRRGAHIGLSVSNKPVKNNVYWGYNTVRDCARWGAQLQGETGGIAHHYFYRCTFENTVRGDPRAPYPKDSGHGFRTNGNCRRLVFEDCTFRNNGGYGVQFGGRDVDALDFLRCDDHRQRAGGRRRAARIYRPGTDRLYGARETRAINSRRQALRRAGAHGRLRPARRNPGRSTCRLPLHVPRGGREDQPSGSGTSATASRRWRPRRRTPSTGPAAIGSR